jgi:hypothetical protein
MATTNRIAATTLAQGASASQVIRPGAENITLMLTVAIPYAKSTDTQVVMTVREPSGGLVRGSCIVTSAGIKQVFIDNIKTATLVVDVICLKGTVRVQVDEITGMAARSGAAALNTTTEITNGTIPTAALAGGAVTLPKTSAFNTIKCLAFAGVAAAGPCNCVGTAVGDRAIMYFGLTTIAGANIHARVIGTDFEATITVVNQVRQNRAADLSTMTFIALLAPAAA